jgi:hypothetical protein
MTQATNLALLDTLQYRAPYVNFDPRTYPAYWERQQYPLRYLDAIGIEIICDMLLAQLSPKEVGSILQVSQYMLLKWVQADEERRKEWDWALNQEADNQMYQGRDLLVNALGKDQLDKADKIAGHLRYMAKGFGSKRWGQKVDVTGVNTGATVSYNFNIALTPEQREKAIEGQSREIKQEEKPALDFKELLGSGLHAVDLTIPGNEKMSYEEAKGCDEESGESTV